MIRKHKKDSYQKQIISSFQSLICHATIKQNNENGREGWGGRDDAMARVGLSCVWVFALAPTVFLLALWFSSLYKKQHYF